MCDKILISKTEVHKKMIPKLKLTLLGKLFFAYITIVLLIGCFVLKDAQAAEINIHMEFAYNGVPELQTLGFKLYQTSPEGVETVVTDIADPDVRIWDGVVQVEPGRSLYALVAYSAELESPKSEAYPFEYIEPATFGMPAPTIIIKFQ